MDHDQVCVGISEHGRERFLAHSSRVSDADTLSWSIENQGYMLRSMGWLIAACSNNAVARLVALDSRGELATEYVRAVAEAAAAGDLGSAPSRDLGADTGSLVVASVVRTAL
ncbi:hypothetical protein [Streptomyces venezuelae]|nr:hypothetical protein [Streptomyces venezuelae]